MPEAGIETLLGDLTCSGCTRCTLHESLFRIQAGLGYGGKCRTQARLGERSYINGSGWTIPRSGRKQQGDIIRYRRIDNAKEIPEDKDMLLLELNY